MLHNERMICEIIWSTNEKSAQLHTEMLSLWFNIPIYDSYDAMGVVLMGGEL